MSKTSFSIYHAAWYSRVGRPLRWGLLSLAVALAAGTFASALEQAPPAFPGPEATEQGEPAESGPAIPAEPEGTPGPAGEAKEENVPESEEPGTRRFEPSGQVPPEVRLEEGRISFEFKKADVYQFLDIMGEVWGRTIVADSSLEGTVSIEGMTNVTLETAFEVFKAVLSVKGFAVIGTLQDHVIKVLPMARVPSQPSEVKIDTPSTELRKGDDILTYVRALRFLDATKLKTELQPLASAEGGSLVAVASTNHLIITDFESNVRRIAQILDQLDQQPPENRELRVITLKNANAQEIETLLEQLFQDQTQALMNRVRQQFGPGRGGMPGTPGMPGGPGGPGGDLQSLLQQGKLDLLGQVSIASDQRTNSLVIYASPQNLQAIEEIVKQLDVNLAPLIIHRIFKLENADATTAADQLNEMFQQTEGTRSTQSPFGRRTGGFGGLFSFSAFGRSSQQTARPGFTTLLENVVIPDVRTNSLIVTATEQNMKIYEQIIKELDTTSGLQNMTAVYPLQYAVASDLVQTLNSYFRGQTQTGGFLLFAFGRQQQQTGRPQDIFQQVTVVAEEKTNSILITAPPQALPEVRRIIEKLDQPLPQVYIHVVIADVTLTEETKLGIEWQWLNALDENSSIGTQFGFFNETSGFKYALINNDFRATLQALVTDMDVKVLSTPHITTLNNVEARITIGQEYPFVESFQQVQGQLNPIPQFDFKEIAITLTVTPHINLTSQAITLDVVQTINDIAGVVQQGGFIQPIVAKREAESSVRVQHGQTIVLGGIMRDREEVEEKTVPLIGDLLKNIPILGELFKAKRKKKERSELMVFMTPFIVMTEEEVDTIKQKYEQRLGQFFKVPPKVSPAILDPFEPLESEGEEPSAKPLARLLEPQELGPPANLEKPYPTPFVLSTPPASPVGSAPLGGETELANGSKSEGRP